LITHGILKAIGWDSLIHEIKIISEHDAVKTNKKVNWKKTKCFDNSNRRRMK